MFRFFLAVIVLALLGADDIGRADSAVTFDHVVNLPVILDDTMPEAARDLAAPYRHDAARHEAPIRLGFPVPREAKMAEPDNVLVIGCESAQFTPLARRDDGTVSWLAADFVAEFKDGEPTAKFQIMQGAGNRPLPDLSNETADGLRLRTDGLLLEWQRKDGSVRVRTLEEEKSGASGDTLEAVEITLANGDVRRINGFDAEVSVNGGRRAEWLLTGRNRQDPRSPAVFVRLTAYRTGSRIDLEADAVAVPGNPVRGMRIITKSGNPIERLTWCDMSGAPKTAARAATRVLVYRERLEGPTGSGMITRKRERLTDGRATDVTAESDVFAFGASLAGGSAERAITLRRAGAAVVVEITAEDQGFSFGAEFQPEETAHIQAAIQRDVPEDRLALEVRNAEYAVWAHGADPMWYAMSGEFDTAVVAPAMEDAWRTARKLTKRSASAAPRAEERRGADGTTVDDPGAFIFEIYQALRFTDGRSKRIMRRAEAAFWEAAGRRTLTWRDFMLARFLGGTPISLEECNAWSRRITAGTDAGDAVGAFRLRKAANDLIAVETAIRAAREEIRTAAERAAPGDLRRGVIASLRILAPSAAPKADDPNARPDAALLSIHASTPLYDGLRAGLFSGDAEHAALDLLEAYGRMAADEYEGKILPLDAALLGGHLAGGQKFILDRLENLLKDDVRRDPEADLAGSMRHQALHVFQNIPVTRTWRPLALRVTKEGNGVRVSWQTPYECVRIRLKKSPKKIVDSGASPGSNGQFAFDAAHEIPFFAADDLAEEPTPGAPNVEQSILVPNAEAAEVAVAARWMPRDVRAANAAFVHAQGQKAAAPVKEKAPAPTTRNEGTAAEKKATGATPVATPVAAEWNRKLIVGVSIGLLVLAVVLYLRRR